MGSTIDLCAIPAGKSPDGTFNLKNPPSLYPAIIAVASVLGAISTTFAVGRLFVNRRKLGIADYFNFIGCVTNIAYTGVIFARPKAYRHIWDTPVCVFDAKSLKILFAQEMLFGPVFFFSKAAILLLYRHIFGVGRRLKIVINISILVVLLNYLSEFPLAAIYSAPRAGHSWSSLLERLKNDVHPLALGGVVQSAVGAALDFYIFFLPLPTLLRLQMPPKRRCQLIGVFSIALLGLGASVASLYFKIKMISSADSSGLGGASTMCSLIETNIALIVGCMPALAHFVTVYVAPSTFIKSLRTRLLGSGSGTRGARGFSKETPNDNTPSLTTFGANQTPRRNDYYELSDTMLLKTDVSTQRDASEIDETHERSRSDRTGGGGQQTV